MTACAAFRVDAGPQIGLGHLRRCVTLAHRLREDGIEVRFLAGSPYPEGVRPWLTGIDVHAIHALNASEQEDARATVAALCETGMRAGVVVVDHYGLAEPWERLVRAAGHRVVAIDDLRHRRHCADVLVSDTDAPFDPALNSCPGPTLVLAGPQYALIGPEFARPAADRNNPLAPVNLLVSYGGSDPTDETRKALEALRLLRQRGVRLGAVAVVIGPAHANARALAQLALEADKATVHVAPESLAPLLRGAGLFLTAAGNSLAEALCVGLPCLVTVTAANQQAMVDMLAVSGAIINVGQSDEVTVQSLATAIERVLRDHERHASAARAQHLFDHLGAARIAMAVQSLMAAEAATP